MAQFYSDLTELALGTGTPTGWTAETGAGTTTIATSTDAAGDGLSRAWTVATASMDYSWNAVGSGVGDMEILTIMQIPAVSNTTVINGIARQQAAAISGYTVGAHDAAGTKTYQLYALSAGSTTQLGTLGKTWAAGEIWWTRVGCSGTTIRGKAWKDGTAEPAAWDVSVTDSTWATGKAGHRASSLGTKLYFIGVGTGTSAAPQPFNYIPTVGSLALSGVAPARVTDNAKSPAAASLALSGPAPSLTLPFNIAPTVGSLALTGNAPVLTVAYKIIPTVGSLSLSTAAPTRVIDLSRSPAVASLALTGNSPVLTFAFTIIPTVGSLALSGVAPSRVTDFAKSPAAGSLALTGVAPARVTDNAKTPAAASLSLSGQTSAVTFAFNIVPSAGSLGLTGATPVLTFAYTIVPGAGSLSLSSDAPSRVSDSQRVPDAGSLALTGVVPSRVTDFPLAPAAGVLTLSADAPVRDENFDLEPPTAYLTLTPGNVVAFVPIIPGDGISGGTFSRGRWRSIKEQERLERENRKRAAEFKKRKKKEELDRRRKEHRERVLAARIAEDQANAVRALEAARQGAIASLSGAHHILMASGQSDAMFKLALEAQRKAQEEQEMLMLLEAA